MTIIADIPVTTQVAQAAVASFLTRRHCLVTYAICIILHEEKIEGIKTAKLLLIFNNKKDLN